MMWSYFYTIMCVFWMAFGIRDYKEKTVEPKEWWFTVGLLYVEIIVLCLLGYCTTITK